MKHTFIKDLWWLWSYGSWIYNYLCKQCLSVHIITDFVSSNLDQWEVYIMWLSLSVTCDRSVISSRSSGFLYKYNWPPRYNWTIVESGVKHHQTNKHIYHKSLVLLYIDIEGQSCQGFLVSQSESRLSWRRRPLPCPHSRS